MASEEAPDTCAECHNFFPVGQRCDRCRNGERDWRERGEGYQIVAYWPNAQTDPAIGYAGDWDEALIKCVLLAKRGENTSIFARTADGMELFRFWGWGVVT